MSGLRVGGRYIEDGEGEVPVEVVDIRWGNVHSEVVFKDRDGVNQTMRQSSFEKYFREVA